ncbi:GumC family protein [Methylobacterium nonmethylotrophicum]|uniref:Lipopolysaccharide biosynthesis protein n=1 Tax=Methylobacterium nonmethylotrophicum TaxID=1141884 RepID=A0A4Z0NSB0_9HYPH|nr:exopolysaccharide transport family protein [Methylobacterium nonmethylotrophicum]TGD99408.1 lipopolysaccharide biosynthesis protein [Methylobacterium nonmethylotrophicum]
MPPPRGQAAKETIVDLGDIWRIIVRRRAIVLGTTTLCALAALVYGVLAAPLYSATSQILIDPRDRQVVNRDLNASAVAPDGGITIVESQVKVIESDTVLLRAIAAEGLETDPEFGAAPTGLVQRLRESLLGSTESVGDPRTAALRKLRRRLAVKRADKVFVVDIIVTVSDPGKAARIVNAIARAYLADQAEARADAARRASGELNGRLDSLRTDLNAAENRLETFKAKHGLIASSGVLVSEQQLTDSNSRLSAARNRVAEAKSKLQDLRTARGGAVDPGALPEAIQSQTIDRLRGQYAELIGKEGELRMQLGPRHPAIQAVRTQKADVKRLIDAELDRIVRASEVEYQRALAAARLLSENLDALRAESVRTNRDTVQLRELESAVAASRSVYDAFLVRSREIAEQANIDPTNARVISWGQPPDERSWPLRGLIFVAGLAAGLGLGIGLAMVREYVRPALLSAGQMERLIGAPVLAVFPPALTLRNTPRAAREAVFALDGLTGFPDARPRSRRGLSVVLTGAEADADARKALTEMLADAATARGDRVLVVETALTASEVGAGCLLEVLRGEASVQAAVTTDPETGTRRLRVGTGQKPVRDAFARENVEAFLDDVCDRFDLVLVDGGDIARSLQIAHFVAQAERVLVVARAGLSLQSEVGAIARVVAATRQRIFGGLLVDDRASGR